MIRAMLVDDEVLTIKMLQKTIDWEKLQISICATAFDGDEAFALFETLMPDLIITDIRMPHMNGLDFIRKVRELGTDTEFIFISGHADFTYAQQAVRLGCADYILKPIDETELEKTLEKAAGKIREKIKPEEEMPPVRQSKIVRDSIELLKQRYASNISLDDICRELAISKNYFCYIFKKETGKRFWEYLTDIRMKQAKVLLRETDMMVSEIAYKTGYESGGYFSKMFKRIYQMTPKQYREL